MTTPKTGSPEWAGSQATPHTTVNEALRRIEAGAGLYLVVDKDLTTPPGSCADGATYIVAGGGAAWAGHIGDLAIAVGVNAANGWYFRDPEEGVFAWVQDENALYYATTATSPAAWTLYSLAGSLALNDLSDVETGPLVDGYVLTYDSDSPSGFKLLPVPAGSLAMDDLTDVFATAPADEDFLQYESSPAGWYAKSRAVADVGYLGSPQIADQDDYTLTLADAGKHYYHATGSSPDHTLTIPANASVPFPIGTVIAVINENAAGNLNIAITSDTLRWTDQTGSRTLGPNGTATLIKVTATVWRMTGDEIT